MSLIYNTMRFGTATFSMKSSLETITAAIPNIYTKPTFSGGTPTITPEPPEPETIPPDDTDTDLPSMFCRINGTPFRIMLAKVTE